MDNLGISTEPSFLEVELPQALIESPSVSTFLPDEEASICPLLSSSSALGPCLLSHPLSPNIAASDITSSNISNTDCKAETSSSGSSTGIAMDALESTSTNLFNKVNYHHLQNNNLSANQEAANHCLKGNRRKSKDTPAFVSWNWPLIRKCTLFVFISGILAMCSIVVAQIASMPKYCNPKTAWYQGNVLYEIYPLTFQDSDNDGLGDLNGVTNSIEYFSNLGVAGVRLNSIFTKANTTLKSIRPELGSQSDFKKMVDTLHSQNISLLMDIPVDYLRSEREEVGVIDLVGESLVHWMNNGVNGFYLKGLPSKDPNMDLSRSLSLWKSLVGKDIIIIVEESILSVTPKSVFKHIDLIDMVLNIESESQELKKRIEKILAEVPVGDDTTWIQWSIGKHYSKNSQKIFASTLMQLILPGTPNIRHSNAMILAENYKQNHTDETQYWAEQLNNSTEKQNDTIVSYNLMAVKKMIALRTQSPSIYKNFACKKNNNESNTKILAHKTEDILIIVRNYPRKFSFLTVTNFESTNLTLDLTSHFFSGIHMVSPRDEKIFFNKLKIDALDTIVVKLDK